MDLTGTLNILGTGFFAITGALAGIRHRMDLLGVIIMAFFVGLGGGTLRNICLDTYPIWLKDNAYIWAVVLPALLTFGVMWHFRQIGKPHLFSHKTFSATQQVFLIFDAFGLGLFAITGSEMALSMNVSWAGAILLGMISAIGGGLIRDLFCNDIPLIFQKEIYATAALIGSAVYINLLHHTSANTAKLLAITLVIAIRLISVYRNWHAPRI